MITLSITIPDTAQDRVLNAFEALYGYQTTVDDGTGKMVPNPVKPDEFVRQQLMAFVINVVASFEGDAAANQARAQALQSADQIALQ